MKKLLTLTVLSLGFVSAHAQQAKMSASPAYDNVQREKRYKDSRSVVHQATYAMPDQQEKVRPTQGISYYKGNNGTSTQLKPVTTPFKRTGIRATQVGGSAK